MVHTLSLPASCSVVELTSRGKDEDESSGGAGSSEEKPLAEEETSLLLLLLLLLRDREIVLPNSFMAESLVTTSDIPVFLVNCN